MKKLSFDSGKLRATKLIFYTHVIILGKKKTDSVPKDKESIK